MSALAADLAAQPALVTGYIADPRPPRPGAVSGRHGANVVCSRSFSPDGEIGAVEIRDGDHSAAAAARCESLAGSSRARVQLGRKYPEACGLTPLGPNGKLLRVTMGSYGIGIRRGVAALAEQTLTTKGCAGLNR
jgi:prolyl-tRNA synthetase